MQWLSSLGSVGEVLRVILLIAEVLLVFNLMIIVHEWGHFLAARWRGLKVEAFYIWFGKPLWKKTINGVEYGLGSIPAGGFVKLPQMAPMDAIEGESRSSESLPPIKPLDKIIVAFAGPLFSFGLAVAFACLVWFFGKPESEPSRTTVIGYVMQGSPAEKAGLLPGDNIKEVDGHSVRRFEGFVDSVRWNIISSEGDTITFKVDRPGQGVIEVPVAAKIVESEQGKVSWWKRIFRRPALREVGITGKETPMVGAVQPNSPAADVALKPRDQILSIEGIPLHSRMQFSEVLEKNSGKPVKLHVRRLEAGKPTEFDVTLSARMPDKLPEGEAAKLYNRPMVGIAWHEKGELQVTHPSVIQQVGDAARSMVNMIGKLISPKSDIGPGHMSGPVGIGHVYYSLLQEPAALLQVLWFSVVLNINLAIMNMLPFPVLDGGHITMAIAEAIRRRPIHTRFLEFVQTACALLLFGFLIFVTLKDTGDIFLGKGGKKSGPTELWLPKEQRGEAGAPAVAPANPGS